MERNRRREKQRERERERESRTTREAEVWPPLRTNVKLQQENSVLPPPPSTHTHTSKQVYKIAVAKSVYSAAGSVFSYRPHGVRGVGQDCKTSQRGALGRKTETFIYTQAA